MPRLSIIAALLFSAGLLAAGCGSEDAGCTDDFDCAGQLVCGADGICQEFVCAVDEDCVDPALQCRQNACVTAGSPGTADAAGSRTD